MHMHILREWKMEDDVTTDSAFEEMYGIIPQYISSTTVSGMADSVTPTPFAAMYGADELEIGFDSMYGSEWASTMDAGPTSGGHSSSLKSTDWGRAVMAGEESKNADFRTSQEPLHLCLGLHSTQLVRPRKTDRAYKYVKRKVVPIPTVRPTGLKRWLGMSYGDLTHEVGAPCCSKYKCHLWVSPWHAIQGRADSCSQSFRDLTAWVCGQLQAMTLSNGDVQYR